MKLLFLIASCLPFVAFIAATMMINAGLLGKENGEEDPHTTSELDNELLA